MDSSRQPAPGQAYGWVVVVASSLMMGMAFGSLIALSVFLRPLEAEFGWGRSVTSFAYSGAAFMTGVMGIAMGRLADRMPPRPLLLTGALVMGAGQMLLSQVQEVWQLYVIYAFMLGGLGNGCFLVPLLTNVGFWFDRRKGIAMGVVLGGQSLGGALMPSIVRWLLAEMSWREAYVMLGLAAWAVLIPLALLVRPAPGLARLRADSALRSTVAAIAPGRLTAVLSAAIVCCCVCMAIPVIHLYSLGVEAGFSAQQAALVVGLMMAVSIVGRVGVGQLADAVGGIRALLIASGIQTATIFWFAQATTLPGLLTIGVLFGVGYGGVIPSYTIIVRELIPAHQVGRSLGVVLFFGNVGMSLGGYLGGLLYDLSGAYPVAFGAGALAGMANLCIVAVLLFATRSRLRRDPEPLPA